VSVEGGRFAPGPIERRKRRVERAAYVILLLTTTALVLPLLAIVAYLVVKAWPVLSWSFLVENPKNYMTAGGIWAALVGTLYVVVLSLAIAAPIGVFAGASSSMPTSVKTTSSVGGFESVRAREPVPVPVCLA
jgi:phosphate transport system permease protein